MVIGAVYSDFGIRRLSFNKEKQDLCWVVEAESS